jgi:hypothetical protein
VDADVIAARGLADLRVSGRLGALGCPEERAVTSPVVSTPSGALNGAVE